MTWQSGSLHGLQIRTDPRHGRRPRVAAVPQIEDEPRVSHGIASKSGGSNVTLAQELFYFSQQMVKASAGPGAIVSEGFGKPYFGFDERWLKALTATPPSQLSIVRVEGDSMSPTLNDGDDILVDLGDCGERLRDGIYVLRVDDALVVKRLALSPLGRRVTVQSDNPAYPDWPDRGLDEINCIGRVIWSGRKVV